MGIRSDWLVCRMDPEAMTLVPEGIQNPLPGAVDAGKKTGTPKTTDNRQTEEYLSMEEETTQKAHEETAGEISSNLNPELDLVFELGRMPMTVAQIAELAQGQIIRLPLGPEEGVVVDIRVNDRVVARGQIVSVGQDTGIQITGIGDRCSI